MGAPKCRAGVTVLILLLCLAHEFRAEGNERGFRAVTVYRTADYDDASSQNFGVTEDARGIIYIANAVGILEYDGVLWRLIKARNDAPVLSVSAMADGRVVVGAVEEIGYLAPVGGEMRYESLTARLPFPAAELGELIDARAIADGAVFITTRSIIALRGNELKVIARYPESTTIRAFVIDGVMMVATPEEGVRRVGRDALEPVTGWEAFKGERIRWATRWSPSQLFVFAGESKCYLFDGKQKTRFASQLTPRLERDRLANAIRLRDQRLAIVTRRGGVLLLRPDGTIDEVIDSRSGLPDADISDASLTSNGSLWIAMDNDVAQIDVSAALTIIDSRSGLRGSVEAITRFQGTLYVGTTSGLYRIDNRRRGNDSEGPRVVPVGEDVLASWSLLPVEDELLAGIHNGIAVIDRAGKFTRIEGLHEATPYVLQRSRYDPGIVYVGLSSGFGVLRRSEGTWRFEGIVEGLPNNVRTIAEERARVVWLGTTVNGVVRVELNHTGPKTTAQARQFGEKWASTFRLHDRVIITDQSRIFRMVDAAGRIVPDRDLRGMAESSDIDTLAEDASENLWMNSRPVGVAIRKANGSYEFDDSLLVDSPGQMVDYIYPESNGVIWIGSDRGLLRFDSKSVRAVGTPRKPLIRRVIIGGKPVAGIADLELPNDFGRIRFEVTGLSHVPGMTYQFRLSPLDERWSEWTKEPFTEFTTLWEGDYTLSVRTRNARRKISPTTSMTFSVLPPWYRTAAAYAAWLVLTLALLFGIVALRGTSLRRRAGKLEEQVMQQTRQLTDALEQLKAAKRDVDEKNRQLELANVRLEELSFDDALTGIANRRQLDETLRAEWNRAQRAGTTIAFILLDLDHFKVLNDTLGHQVGDQCLIAVARLLEEHTRRSGDLAARYGGEEFALILPDTEAAGAMHIAETLRSRIAALAMVNPAAPEGIVTGSFGVAAVVPKERTVSSELVTAADRALYRAKSEGRNRVALAT